MNISINLPNFCTTIRDAIALAGFSYVKALNVVNSALGQARKVKDNETTLGTVKYKEYKKKEDKASFTLKLGSQRYEALASRVGMGNMTAIKFAAWNDSVIACEKLNPSMTVTIAKDSEFGRWLAKVAMPDAIQQPEQPEQPEPDLGEMTQEQEEQVTQ